MWPFGRSNESLGPRGEKLAAKHLKRQGLRILARNYRCPVGEVDLIALDRSIRSTGAETLVFVEVKTRSSDRHIDPESAVNADKQRRLRNVAKYYIQRRRAGAYNLRFDVVAVIVSGDEPVIRHTSNAF